MPARVKARFVEPMLCIARRSAVGQLKLDGYRAVAFKAGERGTVGAALREDKPPGDVRRK